MHTLASGREKAIESAETGTMDKGDKERARVCIFTYANGDTANHTNLIRDHSFVNRPPMSNPINQQMRYRLAMLWISSSNFENI
jgi:hypothetical protein